MDSGPSQFTTFILRVDTQTPGWENTMIKVLKGIPGATFFLDPNGMARVSGNIDPGKALKLLAKAEKHAQLYSIDSGLSNKSSSEIRSDHDHGYDHFLDDHRHGRRYWKSNHQYYHHPYDSFQSSAPRYLHQPPMLPPPLPPQQYYYDSEPAQCMIM